MQPTVIKWSDVDDETAEEHFEREPNGTVRKADLEEGLTVDLEISKPLGSESVTAVNAEITEVHNPFGEVESFKAKCENYKFRVTFPGTNVEIFKDGERTATWKLTDVRQ